jgi:hypothetical protein
MGTGGSLAAVGALAWAAAMGGTGRPASIVGGVAGLGLLAAEPLGRAVVALTGGSPPASPLDRLPARAWSTPAVAAVQAVVVVLAARVAGLCTSVPAAVAVSTATLLVVVAAAVAVSPRDASRAGAVSDRAAGRTGA